MGRARKENTNNLSSVGMMDNGGNTKLRALGFCGADDSVNPDLLGLISNEYPFVEFGVLFRPDKVCLKENYACASLNPNVFSHVKEATPRYASAEWVERVTAVAAKCNGKMRLAAHLCGRRVNDLLLGEEEFVSELATKGFKRVQVNATAVNGVDTSRLSDIDAFSKVVARYRCLEFIIQVGASE